ncbi:MAG: hypothetical protein J6K52_07575 [Clostridia bacterium]|nr:hypothetical protein [Clostridia bacterium]
MESIVGCMESPKPPSDEGGGFCEAKDTGRDNTSKSFFSNYHSVVFGNM